MISYEIDPSLHTQEPQPEQLDDGFSPPHHGEWQASQVQPAPDADAVLSEKSAF